MPKTLTIPSSNEDELWLFEQVVQQLKADYGHSEKKATDLVQNYYKKYTDQDFCAAHNIGTATAEYFCREGYLAITDQIEYYENLGNDFNNAAFIQWQNAKRKW